MGGPVAAAEAPAGADGPPGASEASADAADPTAASGAAPRALVPCDCWGQLTEDVRRLVLRDALLVRPSPLAPRADASPPRRTGGGAPAAGAGYGLAQAVAAARWLDVMERLVVAAEPAAAARRVGELRRCLRQLSAEVGSGRAGAELVELFWIKLAGPLPELGALTRDGSALPALLQAYSAFAAALAIHSGAPMSPAPPPRATGDDLGGGDGGGDEAVGALCRRICQSRGGSLRRALRAVEDELAAQGGGEAALRACNEALVLDPTSPLPYLARARAHLGRGMRWRCAEDARLYQWWAARRGPDRGARAASAALLLAEALAGEAEERAAAAPAGLGSKAACSRLADEAELGLHDACRAQRGGLAAAGAAVQYVGDRIEAIRAACRSAEDLESAPPTVPDASAAAGADGASPSGQHYALPWPLDLTAGLPDAALFSRAPSVGSSQEHEPLELLFLDVRGVLDLLATVHGLAERASAFARRNAEVLHWKYRPKPVHVHLQAPSPQRLAHLLVCLAVAGQAGGGGAEGPRGPAAVAAGSPRGGLGAGGSPGTEEICQDLSTCALLAALVFCRTLTAAQHEEVRRLLSLLVLASTSPAGMRALFPWLELDGGGGRAAELAADAADAAAAAAAGPSAGAAPLTSQEWSQTPLLYSLQQIWTGWLAAGAGEAEEGHAGRVDEAAVHQAAQRSLLGEHAAAACAHLDPEQQPGLGAALSQRHLWALTGHLPAGEPVSDAEAEASAAAAAGQTLEEDDVGRVAAQPQLREPDPRARWRPLLRELAACQRGGGWRGRGWRLNPCALDPWDWTYQPDALADPFQAFSWRLGAGAASGESPAQRPAAAADLARPAEPPLPPRGAAEPPAVEVIWDHLLGQLEALGAVLNAPEAGMRADKGARAPAPEPPPPPPRPAAGAAPSRSAKPSAARDCLPNIVKQQALWTQPAAARPGRRGRASGAAGAAGAPPPPQPWGPPHQEAGQVKEMTPEEVREELEKFRRTRQDRSLDLEIHDYATLASVCKMRADWWGEGASYSDVYKESIDAGEEATWDPAPRGCAPLRLLARAGAGPAWRLAAAAASRRLTFDAIDARTLLCSGMGLLAACTELEPLLRSTPHSYVQTRQCEELFLDHLQAVQAAVALAGSAGSSAAAGEDGALQAAPPPARTARELLAPGVPRPPPRERRAVLSHSGVLRRAGPPGQCAAAQSARGPRTWRQRCEAVRPLPHVLPLVAAAAPLEEPSAPGPLRPAPPPPPPAPPPRADAPLARCLASRLLPEVAQRPKPQASPRYPDELRGSPPEAPAPPYGAESELVARLAQESLSADVGASEAQYLLGVAIRAEPLGGELSLGYLGASRLPVRHDFLFWDSSLEAGGAFASNWPCAAGHPSALREALGGVKDLPPRARGAADEGAKNPDRLASFGWHWPEPGPREAAQALGPRLLRIRRLGGHPSLCLRPPAGDVWRCCNAAFCGRPAAPGGKVPGGGPEATAAGELICERCGCARYCSKACRATHRPAHAFECGALRGLRRAARRAEARGAEESREALGALLQELMLKQSGARGGPAEAESVQINKLVYQTWGDKTPEEVVQSTLFDARACRSHSAAGIVRLMARWLASRQQAPALHAAADGGLVFSVVSGLGHEGDTAAALAPRRMALHVAALQEWRAAAQTFRPPPEMEDRLGSDAALESAACGAFCVALRPLRAPLAELRPLAPVICIAWGEAARAALQAMTVQGPAAAGAGSSASAQGGGRGPPHALPGALAGHSDSIQLIDNVQLDVVTGKAVFVAHAGALRGPASDRGGAGQALVLLLDASRGMQAVSAPEPASSLLRCSH